MTTFARRGAAFPVQNGRAQPSALVGVPQSLLDLVKGPLSFETFIGDETASRSNEQYFSTASGGAVFTSAKVIPTSGDDVSRGLWGVTIDADPVGTKGVVRRQELDAIAIDGFGADRPTIQAARFRANTIAEPTATTWEASPCALGVFSSSTGPVTDGVGVIFDPTVGVASWVVRAIRSGVAIDSVPLGGYDNDFHTAGFLHKGNAVVPFFDNVIFPELAGAEIQPSSEHASLAHRLRTFAAGGVTGDLDLDWIAWGS